MSKTDTRDASEDTETRCCLMCGKTLGRGARFCDRCFDILVAHDRGGDQPAVGV